ncbi:MAG: CCXG family PEP-CTERM protein [Myxococcota bacterium]
MLRCSLLLSLIALALPGFAHALDFQVDFRQSTYQVTAGDAFLDLLAEHQSGALIQDNVIESLENVSTSVHGGGVTSNYSILISTEFTVDVAGEYTFQVGTDWGRGGVAALIDTGSGTVLDERVLTGNLWWANNWNNPSVFTTTHDFEVGDQYTLAWVGFEDCCGGASTLRFSIDGSAYQNLTAGNVGPFLLTPEPGVATLLLLGLGGLAATRSRD